MADAPAESHSAGPPQPSSLLRQRMLTRAATFTEGAQHPGAPRRRSSVLSDYSDTRHSMRSSTDNLLRTRGVNDIDKLASTDEPSYWHSAPLAFAIVPAFAGLLFQNGGAVVTDILLLAFASMFLNWCLRTPWDWYYAAQHVQYVDPDEALCKDTIFEEKEEHRDSDDGSGTEPQSPANQTSTDPKRKQTDSPAPATTARENARQELEFNEMLALAGCFLGPIVGAYLLHAIRSQLTRPAEGLVSNFNLTIFVMAAELRPVSHVIKMKQARILHLQRVVRSDSTDEFRRADVQELSNRIADLESRVAPAHKTDLETMKIGASVRQGIQPQLDALNRAVRRYEKRQAAQSMQVEARFQELENRLRDALSLAAAAVRTGQRPGIFSVALTWVVNFTICGVQTGWAIVTCPFRVVATARNRIKAWFVKSERQTRKRVKGQSSGSFSGQPNSGSRSGR